MAKRRKHKGPGAIMRQLDPSDPRNLDRPEYRERWLELAGSIGRSLADREFDKLEKRKAKRKR